MNPRAYRNSRGTIVREAIPLTAAERYVYYRRQTGAAVLSPAQRRRLRHKANRADAVAKRKEGTAG